MPWDLAVNLVAGAVTTFGGAFAGAWGAYRLEEHRRQLDEVRLRVGAANRAIYTLGNMWSILHQYKKEVTSPFYGKTDAWLNLSAQPIFSYGLTTLDAPALSFLLGTPEANVFAELMLEEHRFHNVVSIIDQRSRLVLQQAWPTITAAGIGINELRPAGEIETVLGISIVRQLTVLTQEIIAQIDADVASLLAVHDKFREAMQRLYPGKRFARFQPTV